MNHATMKLINLRQSLYCILRLNRGYHTKIFKLSSYNPLIRKDKIAIVDEVGCNTFGDLTLNSHKVAKALQNELGKLSNPNKQEKVSFLCGNNSTYANALLGIWKSGNVAVPLCKSHPTSILEYYVKDSESSAVITTKDFIDQIHPILDGYQFKLLLLEDILKENSDEVSNYINNDTSMEDSILTEDHEAIILYTSGTTGSPKGVVHTHKTITSHVNAMVSAWKWTDIDCILHVLPLHHVHGLVNCLLCPLAIGAKVWMLPHFDSDEAWKVLLNVDNDNDVNILMAVPTIYVKLIEHFHKYYNSAADVKKKLLMKKIRLMVSGSGALPTNVLNEWHSISGHTLLEQYGSTEIGRALGSSFSVGSRVPGFVGNPFPGIEARIVEPGTTNVIVTGNDKSTVITSNKMNDINDKNDINTMDLSGNLQVKGPSVFKKYYNRPEATKEEFTSDGWFKTGDIAEYSLATCAYKIVGRKSVDIIKSGGYKIGALAVERTLLDHPSIKEVSVVGVEDSMWGQRVGAVIVLKDAIDDSLDLHTLREWAKEKMPNYTAPTLLKILDQIPRNDMGKVNKKKLVEVFSSDIN